MTEHQEVITFWFEELKPTQWWQVDDALDQQISIRFKEVHHRACRCELELWRESPAGRLAEIIVLDQFSRNIYRNTPQAFSSDPLALALAQEAIKQGADQACNEQQRGFFYLPFMHSESIVIHEIAVQLYQALGNENNLDFENRHKEIIERFGRYPHRNIILGRESTPEEAEFLKQPGSGF